MLEKETGVPIPSDIKERKKRGRGRPPIYPFADMAVGESILVTGGMQLRRKMVEVAAGLTKADAKHFKKPRRYLWDDVGSDQTRIWRIE